MPRWRPPSAASTALITAAGHARLKTELEALWRVRRPEVVRALAAAAAEGDRSENAEYIYRKKQLGEIDRRVRYLSKRLPELRIVSAAPRDRTAIFFGASLALARARDGARLHYRIVGPDEIDGAKGDISIDAPLARAALGRHVGEEFDAPLPTGSERFIVAGVRYESD